MTYTIEQIREIVDKLQSVRREIESSYGYIQALCDAINQAHLIDSQGKNIDLHFNFGSQLPPRECIVIQFSTEQVISRLEDLLKNEQSKLEILLKSL